MEWWVVAIYLLLKTLKQINLNKTTDPTLGQTLNCPHVHNLKS